MAVNSLKKAAATLRKAALAFPQATEDHPWGESAFKVKKKTFLFLSTHDGKLNTTFKLPDSHQLALLNSFASHTGYGLGKSGWITATFEPGDEPPLDILEAWLEESFRAVAPRRLIEVWERGETSK